MEIKILDMIQNLHTTAGDHFFIGITKLGDAGIIWIFLTYGSNSTGISWSGI